MLQQKVPERAILVDPRGINSRIQIALPFQARLHK
jgi:hypothetical protein